MTAEQRQKLREAALAAVRAVEARPDSWAALLKRPGSWELQTSNAFRRIGTDHGDGDVLRATLHPVDRHPDLLAPSGVLDYIVAAQPSVVLELLDYLDKIDFGAPLRRDAVSVVEIRQSTLKIARGLTHEIDELIKVRDALDKIIESKSEVPR